MQLRKICNHPYLFDIPNEEFDKDVESLAASAKVRSTKNGKTRDEVAVRLPDIVSSSGKMLMLERMLPKLFERGHKVLIFSQMTRMLDILADWFDFIKDWKFCRIDGNITIDDRRKQVNTS
jgi:ATP-dependent DNA helicase